PLYAGGEGVGVRGWDCQAPLTPNPSPRRTGARGAGAPPTPLPRAQGRGEQIPHGQPGHVGQPRQAGEAKLLARGENGSHQLPFSPRSACASPPLSPAQAASILFPA